MRINCVVPHCEKSKPGDPRKHWWCCAEHWRERDKRYSKLMRRSLLDGEEEKARYMAGRLIATIIERAAGIG